MRTRQKYLAIALTATFAVAVAGCTADDAAKTPSESLTAAPFGGTPPAQGARAEDSPLQQFLDAGVDVSNGEELQAQAKKDQETIQALIAQCMADEGFEYIPWDPSAQFLNSIDRSDFKVDDKAWVSKFGYGIVNTPKGDRAQAPPTQDADPNLAVCRDAGGCGAEGLLRGALRYDTRGSRRDVRRGVAGSGAV